MTRELASHKITDDIRAQFIVNNGKAYPKVTRGMGMDKVLNVGEFHFEFSSKRYSFTKPLWDHYVPLINHIFLVVRGESFMMMATDARSSNKTNVGKLFSCVSISHCCTSSAIFSSFNALLHVNC